MKHLINNEKLQNIQQEEIENYKKRINLDKQYSEYEKTQMIKTEESNIKYEYDLHQKIPNDIDAFMADYIGPNAPEYPAMHIDDFLRLHFYDEGIETVKKILMPK